MNYIIAFGNPADGFEYVGPFGEAEDANDYADRWLKNGDWWLILLQQPATDDGDKR